MKLGRIQYNIFIQSYSSVIIRGTHQPEYNRVMQGVILTLNKPVSGNILSRCMLTGEYLTSNGSTSHWYCLT